ncbi:response regulator, partial [bacterium]
MAMRVLIADDDPIIRLDLKQMLENLGYEVVAEASDGQQAV